jgi:hypothetical protein
VPLCLTNGETTGLTHPLRSPLEARRYAEQASSGERNGAHRAVAFVLPLSILLTR